MPRLVEAAILLMLVAAPAAATPVTVTDGWFRALPAHLPAGGYFTAHNSGAHDMAITGAQSAACGSLMLHRSTDTGGMSSMTMVDAVTVPAGGTLAFAPGSYHLMCDAPKLVVGGNASVTLRLSDGTSVIAPFSVRGPTGQ